MKQCENGKFISQTKYAGNVLKKFEMGTSKHSNTPMSNSVKLSLDSASKDFDERLYRSMIGSLLYLTPSRLDIAFSVCV